MPNNNPPVKAEIRFTGREMLAINRVDPDISVLLAPSIERLDMQSKCKMLF